MRLKEENDEKLERIEDDDEENEDDTEDEGGEEVISDEVRVLSRTESSRLKLSSVSRSRAVISRSRSRFRFRLITSSLVVNVMLNLLIVFNDLILFRRAMRVSRVRVDYV